MSGNSDPVETADVDLLRWAAVGDKDSFAAIFERYHHVVYRFACAMTGSPDTAEDVTQEVFVVLIRDLRRYVPERAALSTYLYGITRNVNRDRLRRERRFLSLASLGVKPIDGACSADPFRQMVTLETSAEVRRALARIPVKYREVVILCDLHDLSYAEIGAILRTSIGAVRSRLHHGRQLLRRWLSRQGQATVRQTARSSLRCSM
jgi:RNA polymerase sigma-70 factor, ECF subfamily